MRKSISYKLSFIVVLIVVAFGLVVSPAAASLHITNFSGTTKNTGTSNPGNYHHFYSSKNSVKVNFEVESFIQTGGKAGITVEITKE
ncbi:hypothetical protein U9J35_04215 [Rossellomorea aquimaris]|nr:hypothetical protein [Rossellomorea aquimaris]WRP07380.1 hypothetical protein U9J35_04215 [Rossellomorea aquimaris]